MKEIQVNMSAFYGCGCGCGSYSSSETAAIEVSDEAAAAVSELLPGKNPIDQDDIIAAISDGHTELQPLYDAVSRLHTDMVARYWLFDSDNECLDESLEPAFWQDIEAGLYQPEESIDDFRENHADDDDFSDYDFTDEDDLRSAYYESGKEDYLFWVNSHEDDYPFIAERIGLDLDAVYSDIPDLEFTIGK